MEAIARVLTVGDGRARLACEVRSSCSACSAGHGCGLRRSAEGANVVLEVPVRFDTEGLLVPGRMVTVGVRDGDVLRAAALVYLPVLGGLLAGAVLGGWHGGHGDGAVAIGSVLGAACGWALARVTAQRGQPCVSVQRLTRDAEA